MLLVAAYDDDIRLFKKAVRALRKGGGCGREEVEAVRVEEGLGLLHIATTRESVEVCGYLVEVLRVDVDAVDDKGRTPLMYAIHSKNATIVKYLLDHGANQDKADHEGLVPLHSAAGIGDCKILELLLAKGAYIDPVGKAGADVKADRIISALVDATNSGSTECLNFILGAGASHDVPDDVKSIGNKTVERKNYLAAQGIYRKAGDDVKATNILTALLDATNSGSTECLNSLLEAGAIHDFPDDNEHVDKRKMAQLKSLGTKAAERKDYLFASEIYSKAINLDPNNDATLFSNRSHCWLHMGDGEKALQDALECREMRPDWPKAYYRQGAALLLLKDYKSACETLFDGFKLDPKNDAIEHALRYPSEPLPHGTNVLGSYGVVEDLSKH
ncbi:unnamed protein product [Urochloa decumbens]|uniref:Serine/threonine-protein kinase BSK1-like TPR repeats domain-containing protein n=1 Tax=Urochloa decumbens TaxID=240449 RepID=A0ABC9CL72_9POAL